MFEKKEKNSKKSKYFLHLISAKQCTLPSSQHVHLMQNFVSTEIYFYQFAFLRKPYGYDLDYAWYFFLLLILFLLRLHLDDAHVQLKIFKNISERQTFLKNLSHISSRTRLIKILFLMLFFFSFFLKICRRWSKKNGKINLWLFSTQIQTISKCIFRLREREQKRGREAVHNEISWKRKLFHMPSRSFLSIFAKCFFFILSFHSLKA